MHDPRNPGEQQPGDDVADERRSLAEFVERVRGIPRRPQLDAAAIEVVEALEAVGVEPLLLKGPALARILYRPGEHRGYSDVDLLVAPGDLDRSRHALANAGFENSSEYFGIDDVAGVVQAEMWFRNEHETGGAQVDLHWRLAGCEAPAEIAWRALAARRIWIELGGRSVPVLGREGLALHLAMHAAQHGPDDLKALADLSRGIERWDTAVWRSAAQLAEEVGGSSAFAAGLRLVPAGVDLANALTLRSTDGLSWAIGHRATRPRGTFHLQALGSATGMRERVDVLRRSLLPRRKWIESQYPRAARSNARLIAAYGAHLLRAPAWAARAWCYRRRERRAGR